MLVRGLRPMRLLELLCRSVSVVMRLANVRGTIILETGMDPLTLVSGAVSAIVRYGYRRIDSVFCEAVVQQ